MTTEDDFQAALDARPSDWQTRLVFADWLADRGDRRADGYRALGVLRKRAFVCGFDNKPTKAMSGAGWVAIEGPGDKDIHCVPGDWFAAIEGLGGDPRYRPRYEDSRGPKSTRREVEDAVAAAFARLPAARRAELLAAPLPEADPDDAKKRRRRKPKT